MSTFSALERRAATDTSVRAILRRLIVQDPITDYHPACKFLYPWCVGEDASRWDTTATFLVVALWAHGKIPKSPTAPRLTLGQAAGAYVRRTKSKTFQTYMTSLLAADTQQLQSRLWHLVRMLKDYPLDYDDLLLAVRGWNRPFTKIKIDRDFALNSTRSHVEPIS